MISPFLLTQVFTEYNPRRFRPSPTLRGGGGAEECGLAGHSQQSLHPSSLRTKTLPSLDQKYIGDRARQLHFYSVFFCLRRPRKNFVGHISSIEIASLPLVHVFVFRLLNGFHTQFSFKNVYIEICFGAFGAKSKLAIKILLPRFPLPATVRPRGSATSLRAGWRRRGRRPRPPRRMPTARQGGGREGKEAGGGDPRRRRQYRTPKAH